ncbi:MAG TPA: hypothetical protein VGA18_06725 [Rhodothermales bacterium]
MNVGKQFRLGRGSIRVVGEVADFQHRRAGDDLRTQVYYPRSQRGIGSSGSIVVRVDSDARNPGAMIEAILMSIEPEATVEVGSLRCRNPTA